MYIGGWVDRLSLNILSTEFNLMGCGSCSSCGFLARPQLEVFVLSSCIQLDEFRQLQVIVVLVVVIVVVVVVAVRKFAFL